MEINTMEELNNLLLSKISKVVEYVSEKALEEIQEDIQWAIYDEKEGWYKRTGNFKDSFKLDNVKEINEAYIRNMFYDWKSMISPSSETNRGFTHGDSNVPTIIDRRKDLWWILNNSNFNDLESEFGGAYGPRRGKLYLDTFDNEMQSQMAIGRTDGWIRDGCKKYGIKIN